MNTPTMNFLLTDDTALNIVIWFLGGLVVFLLLVLLCMPAFTVGLYLGDSWWGGIVGGVLMLLILGLSLIIHPAVLLLVCLFVPAILYGFTLKLEQDLKNSTA